MKFIQLARYYYEFNLIFSFCAIALRCKSNNDCMKTSHGGALSVRTDFEKYYYQEGVLYLSKLNKKDFFFFKF